MEAIFCLSVFIVLSGIWAFFKTKKRVTNRSGGVYRYDYEQEFEDDSE